MVDKPEPLLAPKAVSRMLGVTELTLRNWRKAGSGPPWIKLNGYMIRYDSADLEAWIESTKTDTAPAA